MLLYDLKKSIINNKLSNFYIFYGDDWFLRNFYLNTIINGNSFDKNIVFNQGNKIVCSSFNEAYKLANTSNLIKKRDILVIYDDNNFKNEYIKYKYDFKKIIILIYDKLDKRTKFYKDNESYIVDFSYLAEDTIVALLQKYYNITNVLASTLVRYIGVDLGLLDITINKIKSYASIEKITLESSTKVLYNSGQLISKVEDVVFNLIDFIMNRDKVKSISYLDYCLETGEPPLIILTLLFKAFIRQLVYELAKERKVNNLGEVTGLSQVQLKIANKYYLKYSSIECNNIIKLIYNTNNNIKTGRLKDELGIKLLIHRILKDE